MSSIQKEFQRLKMRLKQENDHHEPSDLHHHQIHQQIQTSKMSQSQITQVSSPHRSQVNVRSRITNANLMIDTRRQEYNPRHLRIDQQQQQQQQQQQIEHNSSVINAQCLSPRPRPRDCEL